MSSGLFGAGEILKKNIFFLVEEKLEGLKRHPDQPSHPVWQQLSMHR
jgi:hypothetical protein